MQDRDMKCEWMYISNDQYELPMYSASSARELARKVGVTYKTLLKIHYESGKKGKRERVVKVRIDD